MARLSPPDVRAAWIDALSPARFETYVQAAAGDEERALLLYRWEHAWPTLIDHIAHGPDVVTSEIACDPGSQSSSLEARVRLRGMSYGGRAVPVAART